MEKCSLSKIIQQLKNNLKNVTSLSSEKHFTFSSKKTALSFILSLLLLSSLIFSVYTVRYKILEIRSKAESLHPTPSITQMVSKPEEKATKPKVLPLKLQVEDQAGTYTLDVKSELTDNLVKVYLPLTVPYKSYASIPDKVKISIANQIKDSLGPDWFEGYRDFLIEFYQDDKPLPPKSPKESIQTTDPEETIEGVTFVNKDSLWIVNEWETMMQGLRRVLPTFKILYGNCPFSRITIVKENNNECGGWSIGDTIGICTGAYIPTNLISIYGFLFHEVAHSWNTIKNPGNTKVREGMAEGTTTYVLLLEERQTDAWWRYYKPVEPFYNNFTSHSSIRWGLVGSRLSSMIASYFFLEILSTRPELVDIFLRPTLIFKVNL